MERKIVVPKGMVTAACDAWDPSPYTIEGKVERVLEAALRWWSENPIMPTEEFAKNILNQCHGIAPAASSRDGFMGLVMIAGEQWQRRMFLAPEPEVPQFMECDSCRSKPGSPYLCAGCLHNREVINAFRAEWNSVSRNG